MIIFLYPPLKAIVGNAWLQNSRVVSHDESRAFITDSNYPSKCPFVNERAWAALCPKYKSYLSKNRNSVGRSLSFLFGAARKLFDRYIEMNPVRAGIVDHPAEYRWTSYRANAQLEPSALITPHDCYKELGSNVDQRAEAYRRLFKDELQQEVIDQIRDATNGKRESLRRR